MKRGYFFTLDAFLALGIIITGMIIIYSYNSQKTSTEQAHSDANNVLLFLTTTRINEMNNDYISTLITNKTINNPDNTIIEQMGEFFFEGNIKTAKEMLKQLIKGYTQPQYGIAFFVENNLIYERNGTPNLRRNIITSRNIVSGVFNASTMWGPYKTEVRVYQ